MQDRRAIILGLAASSVAGTALAKPKAEADDGLAPGVCRRCGQVHGAETPLKTIK